MQKMPKITSTIFHTKNGKLAKFMSENFDFVINGSTLVQQRCPEVGTAIEIIEKQTVETIKENEPYWKVGMSMPDVGAQAKRLRDHKIHVSKESQFKDIGFLCHTADSDGNCIELLQHDFEKNFKGPYAENPITLGQITIRTSRLEETLDFYQKLGMKLLSVQPVDEYGFCLYFVGFTDLVPPNAADLSSVENREWLWRQPFCTIEIQHVKRREIGAFQDLRQEEGGWAGIRVAVTPQTVAALQRPGEGVIRDPNNIPIYVDVE